MVRRRKTAPMSRSNGEYFTMVGNSESDSESIKRYTRYSFAVLVTILIIFILTCLYAYFKEFPMQIRA